MSIKHGVPNVYVTNGGGGTTLLNGISYENNILPVTLANYLINASYEEYGVTLPDVIEMDGQTLTFLSINSYYEGGFEITAGTFGDTTAVINIEADSNWLVSVPGSVTFLADGKNGVWWVTSSFND